MSGGLDSAVNLAKAAEETEIAIALTFDYGQRAAAREISASASLAAWCGCPHMVIPLPWLKLPSSALTGAMPVPDGNAALDDAARRVWVPNRNGVFVNIGAAFAEEMEADTVIAGFNAEEAATFPDNSRDFVDAANLAFRFSTLSGVVLDSYTLDMRKSEIVELGRDLGVPFEHIWPCYEGGERPCGECPSCLAYRSAMG